MVYSNSFHFSEAVRISCISKFVCHRVDSFKYVNMFARFSKSTLSQQSIKNLTWTFEFRPISIPTSKFVNLKYLLNIYLHLRINKNQQ